MKCSLSTTEKDQIDEAKRTSNLWPGSDSDVNARCRGSDPIEYGCFGSAFTSHPVSVENQISQSHFTGSTRQSDGLTVDAEAGTEGRVKGKEKEKRKRSARRGRTRKSEIRDCRREGKKRTR